MAEVVGAFGGMEAGDHKTAIGAIREARSCVELLRKLAGQLADAPNTNIPMPALFRSDGPLPLDFIAERIIGRVVGVL